MKYRVSFSGFAYVDADSAEQAEDMFWNDYITYEEKEVTEVEQVDEWIVEV